MKTMLAVWASVAALMAAVPIGKANADDRGPLQSLVKEIQMPCQPNTRITLASIASMMIQAN
jgi:hypothetical protein